MSENKPTVAFLCKNNSARSQMAEAILRRKSKGAFEVCSAGIGTKPIKPTVFEVMEEIGYSLEGHYSKKFGELASEKPFDYAILVCQAGGDCPLFDCAAENTICWGIESPFPGVSPTTLPHSDQLIHYRSLRDQLIDQIDIWFDELAADPHYVSVVENV